MKNRNPVLMEKRLLLHYLKVLRKTPTYGEFDLPEMRCNTLVLPDYLALSSQKCDFHRTLFTAITFFGYDDVIDGQRGLYNAIYYDNKRDLEKFKKRFQGVRFAISPDYSQCGDVDHIENIYRLKKSRIVSIWLNHEMNMIVIPLITFPNLKHLEQVLMGLKNCSVVAFSTKGYVNDIEERKILIEAVKRTVDYLDLKAIVVYDVCKDNQAVEKIFAYAIECGIKVVAPPNMLKSRNIALAEKRRRRKCA